MGRPVAAAYSSARRMMAALTTGLPSSLNAAAPALARPTSGASVSPFCPIVTAAIGCTRQWPASRARVITHSTHAALSTTGSVFGMHATSVKPPAAAARVPVSIVSLAGWPGWRRCTCRSTSPGATTAPRASSTSASAGTFTGTRPTTPPSIHSESVSPVRQWRALRMSVFMLPPPRGRCARSARASSA